MIGRVEMLSTTTYIHKSPHTKLRIVSHYKYIHFLLIAASLAIVFYCAVAVREKFPAIGSKFLYDALFATSLSMLVSIMLAWFLEILNIQIENKRLDECRAHALINVFQNVTALLTTFSQYCKQDFLDVDGVDIDATNIIQKNWIEWMSMFRSFWLKKRHMHPAKYQIRKDEIDGNVDEIIESIKRMEPYLFDLRTIGALSADEYNSLIHTKNTLIDFKKYTLMVSLNGYMSDLKKQIDIFPDFKLINSTRHSSGGFWLHP